MADSDNAPVLGQDLGTKPVVVAYFPISPGIAAVFFSKQHSFLSPLLATEVITRVQPDAEVLNQNTLIVQKAQRFVVASEKSPDIFKVASTRNKGRAHAQQTAMPVVGGRIVEQWATRANPMIRQARMPFFALRRVSA
jgi:hypothetical protein